MAESYRPYRVEVRGTLVSSSPFHIGTGQRLSLATDAPIIRDERDLPYIPGSTLRGVVRAHLEREARLLGCTQVDIERLFGKIPHKRAGMQVSEFGRATFEDACLGEVGSSSAEIRDHVKISEHTGAAAAGAKFDAEVALGSPKFSFALSYNGDSDRDPEMRLLGEAIRSLAEGKIRVGAKSGWGYGAIKLTNAKWAAFDRANAPGLSSWLRFRAGLGEPEWAALPLASSATHAIRSAGAPDAARLPFSELSLDLRLRFNGPVLVKAPIPPIKSQPDDEAARPSTYGERGLTVADGIFVSRADDQQFYLPGSSLRGVLRSQAVRIGRTLVGNETLVDRLFGKIKKGKGGQKGRIEIGDGELEGFGTPIYLDHVAIDRITSTAADEKKFATCGLISPVFRTSVRLRVEKHEWELVAIFGFLLRDLLDGRLWVGSGTTRGFGRIARVEIVEATWSDAGMLRSEDSREAKRILNATFEELNFIWQKAEAAWKAAI